MPSTGTTICLSSRSIGIPLQLWSLQIPADSNHCLPTHLLDLSSGPLPLTSVVHHLLCSPTPYAMRSTIPSIAAIRNSASSKTNYKHRINVERSSPSVPLLTPMTLIKQLILERSWTIAMYFRKRPASIHRKPPRSRTPKHHPRRSVSSLLSYDGGHRSNYCPRLRPLRHSDLVPNQSTGGREIPRGWDGLGT